MMRKGMGLSATTAAAMAMIFGVAAHAQTDNAPGKTATGRKVGGVPSDALGLCKDGTYVSTGSKQSACSRHGGMKIWYPDGPEHPTDADYAEPAAGKTATGRKVGGVPSDALGLCKDGTYVSTGMKVTAFSAHGGMEIWYPDGTPNN